ncbi:MAG: Fic family protein [Tabrizicola sp.]|nr:Fic family protein [Tabrizicola sp.]
MVVETPRILKALTAAHRHLAELKGRAASIPNQGILIDTLSLQEAQASSEIENIITTQDELYEIGSGPTRHLSPEQKEVARYREALKHGLDLLLQRQGLITNNALIGMFQILKQSTGDFRSAPGTSLKNDATGEIIYVPPQRKDEIVSHMADLETFLNDPARSDLDPLVKMAILHHQFESIHPFPDGNGRIGRILNVLYLVQQGLLDIPILYLSRFITRNKSEYYRLLQQVRDDGAWDDWIVYMITAVSETSRDTVQLIIGIRQMMAETKSRMRERHKSIYSQDLLNNIFRHPYTRIEYVVEECQVGRQAAARYLDRLAADDMLVKIKRGLNNYYVNVPLVELLANNGTPPPPS